MKPREKTITLKEACNHLDISETKLRRLLAKNKIPACKPAGRWRFYISELDDWIQKGRQEIIDGKEETTT